MAGLLSPQQVAEAMRRAAMMQAMMQQAGMPPGAGGSIGPMGFTVRLEPCPLITALETTYQQQILRPIEEAYVRELSFSGRGVRSEVTFFRINCPGFSIDLDILLRADLVEALGPVGRAPGSIFRALPRRVFVGTADIAFRLGGFIELVFSPLTLQYTARLCIFGQIRRFNLSNIPNDIENLARAAVNRLIRQPICYDVTRYFSQSELAAAGQRGQRLP